MRAPRVTKAIVAVRNISINVYRQYAFYFILLHWITAQIKKIIIRLIR